jgi:hypothetical protein
MEKIKHILLTIALIVLAFSTGCDEVTKETGTIIFVPESVTIKSSQTSNTTQNVILNVKNSAGNPIQGLEVIIYMLMHNHRPFANAGGVVSFLDENSNPLVVTSPNNSSVQGTTISKKTNANGNVEFSVEFPLGGTYGFEIIAFSARTSATLKIDVSTGA